MTLSITKSSALFLAMLLAIVTPSSAQASLSDPSGDSVQNPFPHSPVPHWSFTQRPLTDITGDTSSEANTLYRVRNAIRIGGENIAVANEGSFEILSFDAEGTLQWSFGGEGNGPREFRSLTGLQVGLFGDTLFVFDDVLQRITMIADGGDWHRIHRLRMGQMPVTEARRFRDGRWLFVRETQPSPVNVPSVVRGTVEFFAADIRSGSRTPVTSAPGIPWAVFTIGGDTGWRIPPFGAGPTWDLFRNCLYLAVPTEYAVRVFDRFGNLVLTIDFPSARLQRVTDAHITEYTNGILASAPPGARKVLMQVLHAIPLPTYLPTYNDIHIDTMGYIWLQTYTPPFGQGNEWTVLEPDGHLLGTVMLPVDLKVFQIGADYVLGLWKDSAGQEIIRLYGLNRFIPDAPEPPECR